MERRKPTPSVPSLFVPIFFVLCGMTVLCVIMLAVRAYRLDFVSYRFLLWNLFLAWLPLIVSMAASGLAKVLRGAGLAVSLVVLGVAWLLLYPNAPYLTTDFIHLIVNSPYDWVGAQDSLVLWYDLIIFFLFSWCGLLLGYISMFHFHSIVRHYAGEAFGWLFIVVVSFLGGFGVYLGRVIRLNSWDALFSPFRLIDGVLEGLGRHGAIFTALFGMLILIVYLSLNSLRLIRHGSPARQEG